MLVTLGLSWVGYMKTVISVLLLATLALAPCTSFGDIERAVEAYEAGDYETAVKLFRPCADGEPQRPDRRSRDEPCDRPGRARSGAVDVVGAGLLAQDSGQDRLSAKLGPTCAKHPGFSSLLGTSALRHYSVGSDYG